MYSLIGVVSDAHGNAPAFDQAVALLLEQGAERIYFLGDAVGYIPSVAVLDSLARLGDLVRCIRGNHEAMLLEARINSEREGVYQLETLRLSLTPAHLAMLASWPDSRREVNYGQRLLFLHGSPADPTYGYVYPDSDLSVFLPDADWVFMGNTHHPFIREDSGVFYVNIGSCGLPRDDGRYGSVALLDARARSVRILRFDIEAKSGELLERFPMVHKSVRDVYERRRHEIVGDIL